MKITVGRGYLSPFRGVEKPGDLLKRKESKSMDLIVSVTPSVEILCCDSGEIISANEWISRFGYDGTHALMVSIFIKRIPGCEKRLEFIAKEVNALGCI